MNRTFKIVLIISLLLNVVFVLMQLLKPKPHRLAQAWEKTVDITKVKQEFLDSLFKKYPVLETKKYLFLNFWATGSGNSIQQLPMLDTLIEPLRPEVGYILVNDEKPDYSARVLRQDSASTKNFLFMNRSEDFILAINQELNFKRTFYRYPMIPMNIILDTKGKIIYFDTLWGLSGPRWPEDSLKDKKIVNQLHKALNDLK